MRRRSGSETQGPPKRSCGRPRGTCLEINRFLLHFAHVHIDDGDALLLLSRACRKKSTDDVEMLKVCVPDGRTQRCLHWGLSCLWIGVHTYIPSIPTNQHIETLHWDHGCRVAAYYSAQRTSSVVSCVLICNICKEVLFSMARPHGI